MEKVRIFNDRNVGVGEIPFIIAEIGNNHNGSIDFAKKMNRLLVITRGEKGAIAIHNEKVVECGIKKGLNIVDLTGAGDLFAAGFLLGYINGENLEQCGNKGVIFASKIIQIYGARL